jgi:hypothetical protein
VRRRQDLFPTELLLFRAADIDRAKWKMRVRLANISIALTLLGCAIAVYNGKQMKPGESLTSKRQDQHKEWEEERLRNKKQQE